jgi:hypothetical protein
LRADEIPVNEYTLLPMTDNWFFADGFNFKDLV